MRNRLLAAGTVALVQTGLVLAGFAPIAPALAKDMSAAEFMAAANTNKDNTLSKEEVTTFAKKKFAEIESDHDKTLDQKELQGRLSDSGMSAADTDSDKTVDEAEFVGYAGKLFDQANTAGTKTLSMKELESPAGEKLRMLLH